MNPLRLPMDPLAQLQADLKAAKAEVAEWQDRFLRKAAEFENYRKRIGEGKSRLHDAGQKLVLIEFLPLADACERALKSLGEAEERDEVSRSSTRRESNCSTNSCWIL